MCALFVDTLYHLKIGCLESEKMKKIDKTYDSIAKEMVEKNTTKGVYKPKPLRKLRVVKKSWYEKRHRIGMEKAKRQILILADCYGTSVIQDKLERLEGNDIVDIIEARVLGGKIKEVHVTGRIADKLAASDGIVGRHWYGKNDTITKLYSVPIIHKNDSFPELDAGNLDNRAWRYRRNPTGREQWLKEIKFIEE
jgi:hypothetical protein